MSPTSTPRPTDPAWKAELHPLLARAHRGDATVLPELQTFLDAHPEVWRQCGDLARHAEESLLTLATGNDLFGKEAVRKKLAEIKAELGGAEPPPLEKLLVERIAVCWLAVYFAEADAAGGAEERPGRLGREAITPASGSTAPTAATCTRSSSWPSSASCSGPRSARWNSSTPAPWHRPPGIRAAVAVRASLLRPRPTDSPAPHLMHEWNPS